MCDRFRCELCNSLEEPGAHLVPAGEQGLWSSPRRSGSCSGGGDDSRGVRAGTGLRRREESAGEELAPGLGSWIYSAKQESYMLCRSGYLYSWSGWTRGWVSIEGGHPRTGGDQASSYDPRRDGEPWEAEVGPSKEQRSIQTWRWQFMVRTAQ